MTSKPKPHIPDLKFRLRTAFTHAKDLFDAKALRAEDSSGLTDVREFRAALLLLDTLVVQDRFTSLGALNDCCLALFIYGKALGEDRFNMQQREILNLVREIDLVREKHF
jgi:hypothetical protein